MNTSYLSGLSHCRRLLAGYRRSERGAAIVEFALVTPILLAALAGISDGATLLMRQNAMHSGLSSSAQYIMSGGADLTTARQVGLTSWADHSSAASVTASKACYCASAPGTCSTLCTDQTVPKAYVKIAASDTFEGWYGNATLSAEQDVRIR